MKYFCNPTNLDYKYQMIESFGEKTVSRELADPSMILFKGKYFLFPSMCGGFYVSENLAEWQFYRYKNLPQHDYAPDVRVIGEYIYFCASNHKKCAFYRTKDPINEEFEEIPTDLIFWDPDMFLDDDGRLYFYWGCSNKEPIYGIELDVETMKPIGEKKAILSYNPSQGFERTGNDHILLPPKDEMQKMMRQYIGTAPFIEGAWMTKYNGKYYLQYAAPGTEFNVYSDGVYVSDKPLEGFVPAKNNPFSYKPGGFVTGAGHGSTMWDKQKNLWHISTMRISVNHKFERRLGVFPCEFDDEGELVCNQRYADFPVTLSYGKQDVWANPEWMLLSYDKKATASSVNGDKTPDLAVNEDIRTFWQAATNNEGEWIELDLGDIYDVRALQVNFADGKLPFAVPNGAPLGGDSYSQRFIDNRTYYTRWLLEASLDGRDYFTVEDKRDCNTNLPHDFIVKEEGFKARYIKLTVAQLPFNQNAAVSGLRVFGFGHGAKPAKTSIVEAVRQNGIDLHLKWSDVVDADGYNILWGYSPDRLYHSYMVYQKTEQYVGALNDGQKCFVRIDTFNENGITEGEVQEIF